MTEERFDDYTLQKECESIAQDILERYIQDNDYQNEMVDEHDDELSDDVSQTVDGHEWVIYHYKALRFVAECDTENGDDFVRDVGFDDYQSIHQLASTILYGEMQARVTRHLWSLVEEHNADVED